jgi:hypothetical protein
MWPSDICYQALFHIWLEELPKRTSLGFRVIVYIEMLYTDVQVILEPLWRLSQNC